MTASSRKANLLALLIVILLLGVTYYLQHYAGFVPCPLCMLQRFAMMGLGLIFLIGTIFYFQRTGRIILSVLSYLYALAGVVLAGRQVWLQHLPPAASSGSDCGASLEYMMQALPLSQVMNKVFSGSSECSLVDWRFLHLSLAEWALISFLGFLLFTACQFFSALRMQRRWF
jgi:disulfide bond formation protein DsbB